MFDFFEKIWGTVELVLSFFFNLIESMINAIAVMSNGATFVMQLSGLMPTIIGSSMLIVVFMAVIKFLIGR